MNIVVYVCVCVCKRERVGGWEGVRWRWRGAMEKNKQDDREFLLYYTEWSGEASFIR